MAYNIGGVKMVSTKTSRDVGMVPSSWMEKPTSGKSIGTRKGIPWDSNNRGQDLSASRHIGYILHHQSPYIWQHLICLVRVQFQAKCYSDLHYWSYCTAVWSPVHRTYLHVLPLLTVFVSTIYDNVPSHARDVHSIAMQELPVTMHSSFNVCMSGIT